MESLLAPLLVLVTVTAALIPLLLLSMLGRPARPAPSGLDDNRRAATEPIWRAWVDEPATAASGDRE